MSGIYLLDKCHRKRSPAVIENIIKNILPPNVIPTDCFPTVKGFRLNYPNEQDANAFFTPANYSKLVYSKLDPVFAHFTEEHRLVLIPNVPLPSYYVDKDTLKSHISEKIISTSY